MLELDPDDRAALLRRACEIVEAYASQGADAPLAPTLDPNALRAAVDAWDFARPLDAGIALEAAASAMRAGQVHATHPRHFGLFHPAPSSLGVVGALLAAAFDPQLATASHAPWAVAIEDRLVVAFGERFGFPREETEGSFTSGGAEANATALLAALSHAFPDVGRRGVRALPSDPVAYVSAEAHPTMARAARVAGLGTEAVRVIPADARQRMKVDALRAAIARDRRAGARPFLVVATVGTTSSGAIDPLPAIADVAERASCWLHVDAAWGGLAALVPALGPAIDGCARADSITFDPHKALSSPLGAGMLLVRRPGVLARVFHDRAGYMPRDASRDPYARSMQWSRRFIGLGVLLTLAAAGWDGLAASLGRQVALADRLRDQLRARGFRVVNDTPLPLVCFVDDTRDDGATPRVLDALARGALARGGGWLSVTRLASGARALRACVNNHRTREADVDALVDALADARHDVPRDVPRG